MDKLMFEIKTGQFSLQHPKPMKIKGGMDSVRHTIAGREGGIYKYSMLGSQNAISEVPEIPEPPKPHDDSKLADDIAKKIIDDLNKEKQQETGMIGGMGGKQSETSKIITELTKRDQEKEAKAKAEEQRQEEISKNAKIPSDPPPFDLDTPEGKKGIAEVDKYLIEKYGKKQAVVLRDALLDDSKGFTKTLKMIREINKKITAFNLNDAERWEQWANNMVVEYGDMIIDALGKGSELALAEYGIPPEKSQQFIGGVTSIIKKFKPSTSKDFVKTMNELKAKLLEGKPHWKAKYNAIAKINWDKIGKDIDRELGYVDDMDKVMTKKKKI